MPHWSKYKNRVLRVWFSPPPPPLHPWLVLEFNPFDRLHKFDRPSGTLTPFINRRRLAGWTSVLTRYSTLAYHSSPYPIGKKWSAETVPVWTTVFASWSPKLTLWRLNFKWWELTINTLNANWETPNEKKMTTDQKVDSKYKKYNAWTVKATNFAAPCQE